MLVDTLILIMALCLAVNTYRVGYTRGKADMLKIAIQKCQMDTAFDISTILYDAYEKGQLNLTETHKNDLDESEEV